MDKEKYRIYLQSEHWLKLKEQKQKPERCAVCFEKLGAFYKCHLHHLQYKNVYDVEPEDLRWVCDRCHTEIHKGIDDGKIPQIGDSSEIFNITQSYVRKAIKWKHPLKKKNFWVGNMKVNYNLHPNW